MSNRRGRSQWRSSVQLIFSGTLVHSTVVNAMEIYQRRIIGVDDEGKIAFVDNAENIDDVAKKFGFSKDDVIYLTSDRQFLMPGLVDTHIHAPQYVVTGTGYDLPLLDWLKTYTFPAESRFSNKEFAKHAYRKVVSRLLMNGTTTASYFATIHNEATEILCDIIAELGQRAYVGKVCMDKNSPEYYIEKTEQSITDTERFIKYVLKQQNPLLTPVVTPRFVLSCTSELMKKLGKLAKKFDVPIQSHLGESKKEIAMVREEYQDIPSYTEVYDKHSLLNSKTYMAHCCHSTDEELDLMLERNTGVSHCPTSNLGIRSGLADVRVMLNRSMKVGLGTDVSGGDSPSMLNAIRDCVKVSNVISMGKTKAYKPINYKEAFYLATLGGSQVLGLDDQIGNFEVGKYFDALLIDCGVEDSPFDCFNADDLKDTFQKFVFLGCEGSLSASGANVCSRSQSYLQSYKQSYQISWKRKSNTKCGLWGWGRCTVYRTTYGIAYRTATRKAYKAVYFCCPGWKQQGNGNGCPIAICKNSCVNGRCTKPDTCSCNAGFYGQRCDRECQPHKWGPHCLHDCKCQNGAKCDSRTGACACTPGWKGQYCNQSCDQGFYGDKCQYQCLCLNGATCDPVTGNCTCAPGYTRARCDRPCNQGWYGQDCKNRCACLNDAECDHVHGTCNCTAGWQGYFCGTKCPEGMYGYNCSQKCINCLNGAVCNHVNGSCTCAPGYQGYRCGKLCPPGSYGHFCAEECRCRNGTCSPVDGSCNCTVGYTGVYCDKPCEAGSAGVNCTKHCNCTMWGTCNQFTGKCQCQPGYQGDHCELECQEGFYGPQCKGHCQCVNNATCNKKDGTCNCPPGWIGVWCNNPCPPGYYGKNCRTKCICQNGGSCDPVDGRCTCVNEWQGENCDLLCVNWTYGVNCRNSCLCNQTQTQRCHGITGKCFCKDGYAGSFCHQKIKCNNGWYGNSCNKKCRCSNGAPCDVVSGVCDCPPGFLPPSCADKCQSGRFGYQCSETCQCKHGASCDHVTGSCSCTPGWQGAFCEQGCPSGWYGQECNNSCDCLHGASCHHITGKCVCGAGWEGTKCNKSCRDGFYGFGCQSLCQCYGNNTRSCDRVDGTCNCDPGWTGRECTLFCPRGTFGLNCSNTCKCNKASTDNCDHVTGACTCLAGWIGDQCQLECPDGNYGYKCRKECKTECTLPNMQTKCDHVNGQCYCLPGYTSQFCNQTCPQGRYGVGCNNPCQCKNNATCDRVNGECQCLPGFQGEFCEEAQLSTASPSPGDRNSSKAGRSEETGSSSYVTSAVVAVAVAMVAIILILVLVYLRKKRLVVLKIGKGLSTRRLLNSPKTPSKFEEGREGDDDIYAAEDVSVNPIYGDAANPDDVPLELIHGPGQDRPQSMTLKSVSNPNYESTLALGEESERTANNPIYQTSSDFQEENPLYDSSSFSAADAAGRGIPNAGLNPLYEAGPIGSSSYAGRSEHGSEAGMNPLYQAATSYLSQSDFNPLYEATSDMNPLYESTVTPSPEQNVDPSGSAVRRRVDSRSKGRLRSLSRDKEPAEDEVPIVAGESSDRPGNDDGLGIANRGADITFNELYGSVGEPGALPLEDEYEVPPTLPPREHSKRS